MPDSPDSSGASPSADLAALRIDRSRTSARRRRGGLGRWVLLLLLIGGGLLFRRPLLEQVDRWRLQEVQVGRVIERSGAAAGAVSGAAANGYVVARTRAALSADAPGRIVEMRVVEGSVLRKGDVVARLYSEELEAALQRSEAEVTRGQATLERARAELRRANDELANLDSSIRAREAGLREARADRGLAATELVRAEELVTDGIGATQLLDQRRSADEAAEARVLGAEAQLELARGTRRRGSAEVSVAEAALAEATAGVAVAQAAREQARAALEKTFVRAPFDGVVVQKEAEVGEVVSPNSQGGSTARGSVATMVDLDSLEVQANVPETTLSAVQVGAPARIFLDAEPERPYEGRIDRLWPMADRQKATVEVRVAFLEPDDQLRPEMGVRVVFLDEAPEDEGADAPGGEPLRALMVPDAALVRVEGQLGVFQLERDTVRFTPIEVGEASGGRTVVLSGLRARDEVVLDPPRDLVDGERVRIRDEA